MSDISAHLDIRRRRVRFWIGPLTGLIFGPLIAHVYLWLPTSEWLGGYPTDPVICVLGATFFGLCYGQAVGLAVVLSVWGVQRLSGYGSATSPDLSRAETWSETMRSAPHAGSDDERIARRTDLSSQPDKRVGSRPAEDEPGDGIVQG